MTKSIPADDREPGIYFGLASQIYHASPSLGSTDLRDLLNPTEFYATWSGNPNRTFDEDTEALTFGRALHLMVLEGKKALEREFFVEPSGPGILVTQDDIKKFLDGMRLNTSGKKAELIKRAKAADRRVKIYDDLVETEKAKGNGKRMMLKADAWARIAIATTHITANPDLAESFRGGRSEVSVFWEKDGVRYKVRYDYIKVALDLEMRPMVIITDLKSFGAQPGEDFEIAIDRGVKRNIIQGAHYLSSLEPMKEHVKNLRIFGTDDEEDLKWLKKVLAAKQSCFGWTFYKRTGAPYANGRYVFPEEPLVNVGRSDIEARVTKFKAYMDRFGQNGPWVTMERPRHSSIDDMRY